MNITLKYNSQQSKEEKKKYLINMQIRFAIKIMGHDN